MEKIHQETIEEVAEDAGTEEEVPAGKESKDGKKSKSSKKDKKKSE